jgi:hypothetical protein
VRLLVQVPAVEEQIPPDCPTGGEEFFDSDEVGDEWSGWLLAAAGRGRGLRPDLERDWRGTRVAGDVGDGGAGSAEECAVHIVEP